MRRALLLALFTAAPAIAAAQRPRAPVDLGVVTLAVPLPPPQAFVIYTRTPPPVPAATALPEDTRAAFAAWQGAEERVRRGVERVREARDAGAPDATLLGALRAQSDEATRLAADLEARLARARPVPLGPEAWLLLGDLRYRRAQSERLDALERASSCTADCPPDPPLELRATLEAWSRCDGRDAAGAWARYARAFALREGGDDAASEALVRDALAIAPLPDALEAAAALLLGELLDAAGNPSDLAYERASQHGPPDLRAVAQLRRARYLLSAGRFVPAVLAATAVQGASDPGMRNEADQIRQEAAFALGPRAPAELPPQLAPDDRAQLLLRAANRLRVEGHYAWARRDLDAAGALATDSALRAEITSLLAALPASSNETTESWLRRGVRFCIRRNPALVTAPGSLDVTVRAAARVTVTAQHATSAVQGLARCLVAEAPPPEAPLRGTFRARIEMLER